MGRSGREVGSADGVCGGSDQGPMTESRKRVARRKKTADETLSLYDITAKLRSGACVPALREAVKSWKAGGCKGISETTRTLVNSWFEASHKTRTGMACKYYDFQRIAIETRLYVGE